MSTKKTRVIMDGHTANTTVVMDTDPVGFKDMVIRLFEKYKEV